METQKVRVKADADGMVQLQLPPAIANQEIDLVIVFQPSSEPTTSTPDPDMPESNGWHPDFFTEVLGSWHGEGIERPEQLPWETREELCFDNLEE